MDPLSRAARLRVRAGVDFRATHDGGMLVDTDTGACFQLNRVGAELWSHFSGSGSGSIHSAVELLRLRYRQTGERLESDVALLCAELVKAGLVIVGSPLDRADV